jgi:histone acetyltransferase
LITYADDTAIGFFKKQAFRFVKESPENDWFGYIKPYDGGSLMECFVYQKFRYGCFRERVREQRGMLLGRIKSYFMGERRYDLRVLSELRWRIFGDG